MFDMWRQTRPSSLRDLPLSEAYRHFFIGVPANTAELRDAAYRLRYQVFCVENHVFNPTEHPDGLERDEYDDRSLQAVLLHRPSQALVGTVRVVFHQAGARCGSLPFFKICKHPRLNDPEFLPLETTAEVGRFAVCKTFRRRHGDGIFGRSYGQEELANDRRRLIPHITLGLMTAALQMGKPRGISHVCAVMEPSLLRLLGYLGLHFEPIGPVVEYYGWRQPCYARLSDLFSTLQKTRPDVWDVVTDGGALTRYCEARV